MSQFEKALARLMTRPKDFTWHELQTVMRNLGYSEKKGSGSRRKFVHSDPSCCIRLHEPHPHKNLKPYAISNVIIQLKQFGHL
jgi:hypothetical protein